METITNIFRSQKSISELKMPAYLYKIEGIAHGSDRYKKLNYAVRQFSQKVIAPCSSLTDTSNDLILSLAKIDAPLSLEDYKIVPIKEINVSDYPAQFERFSYTVAESILKKRNFWSNGYNAFYEYEPDVRTEDFIVYRGVWIRFDVIDDHLLFTLDPISRITDSNTLWKRILKYGLDEAKKKIDHYFVLDHGFKKSICRLLKIDNEIPITEPSFLLDGKKISVFDFLTKTNPSLGKTISKDEFTVQIQYGTDKNSKIYHTAPSLLHEILSTSNLNRNASKEYFLEPKKRHSLTTKFLSYFDPLDYSSNILVKFESEDITVHKKANLMDPPTLVFGSNTKVKPVIEELKRYKEFKLKEFGPALKIPVFKKIPIIAPKHISNQDTLSLYNDFRKQISQYLRIEIPEKTIIWKYDVPSDVSENFATFKDDIAGSLIILNDGDEDSYYEFKNIFGNKPSQMVTFSTMNQKYHLPPEKMGKYWSKIFMASVGLLAKMGCCPWMLDNSLNFDFNIGIDVGGRYGKVVCYSYLFDKSGRNLGIGRYMPQKKESIDSDAIQHALESIIRNKHESKIKSIAIYRDGQLFENELKGIRKATENLMQEHLIDDNPIVIGINVKKSVPFRFYTMNNGSIEDCRIGSNFVLDDKRGILATTGFPLVFQGMGKPLLIEKIPIIGDMEIDKVMRDVLYLSHINWGSVSLGMKLPATIKYAEDQIDLLERGVNSTILPI